MAEVLKYYLDHIGLYKFLHKDPTGAAVWEEAGLRGTYYWGLNFKMEIEPLLNDIQKQILANLKVITASLEGSDWFKNYVDEWAAEKKRLEEALSAAYDKCKELEKYETYYNMQMKMKHGEK